MLSKKLSLCAGVIVVLFSVTTTIDAQDSTICRDKRGRRVRLHETFVGSIGEQRQVRFKVSDSASDYGFDVSVLDTQSIVRLGKEIVHQYAEAIRADSSEVALISARRDGSSWVLDFRQAKSGIGVFGAWINIGIHRSGKVRMITSTAYPHVECPTIPIISAERAIEIVRAHNKNANVNGTPALVILPKKGAKGNAFYLTWAVSAESASTPLYFVDSGNGEIIHQVTTLD